MRSSFQRWVLSAIFLAFLLPTTVLAQSQAQLQHVDAAITAGTEALQKQRYLVAERHFKAAMEGITQFAIMDHRRAVVLHGLAMISVTRQRYAEADQYLNQALVLVQKLQGPGHPDVARCLINLGDLRYTVGQLEAALAYYQAAVEIIERGQGPNDAGLIVPISNSAGVLNDLQRYDEAVPLLKRGTELIDRHGGAPADLIWSLKTLAAIYLKQQKTADADPVLTRLIPLAEQAWGDTNPDLEPLLTNLAHIRKAGGKIAEAEALYKKALAVQLKDPTPDEQAMAATRHHLGMIAAEKKSYGEAINYLTAALDVRKKTYGENSLETAAVEQTLGEIYGAQKEFDKATEVLTRVLTVRENKRGRTHAETGDTLKVLCWAEFNQGNYPEADRHARRAIEILDRTAGKEHPDLVQPLMIVGVVAHSAAKYQEAENHYRRALAIREKAVGKEHPELLPILKNYADVLLKQERTDEAVELIKRMRAIEEKFGIR